MPSIGIDAGVVLLLLLPGFISARIVQAFAISSKSSEFEKVIDALLHTFVVATFYGLLVQRLPLQINTWTQDGKAHYTVNVLRGPLLSLLLIAVVWGSIITICHNFNFPWNLLCKWRVVHRSAWSSVWHDVFYRYADTDYVQIELSDGRLVIGELRHYSNNPKDASLFIQKAAWVNPDDGGCTEIPGSGILLTKDSGIRNVVFLAPIVKEESSTSAESTSVLDVPQYLTERQSR